MRRVDPTDRSDPLEVRGHGLSNRKYLSKTQRYQAQRDGRNAILVDGNLSFSRHLRI